MKTTTDELQTLIAIVDAGSITAAAERLEQTTSGVSRTLTRLEKKLQTTLLRRTTRRLQLTDEGEIFLEHARKILQAFDEAEESLVANKEPQGLLKVDSASPFILHSIVPYMAEFAKLYPKIQIELHSSERFIDLIEKRIDIAIRIGNLQDSTLHAKPLGSSLLRILASPEYLKQYGTPKTVEDLAKHRLLGFTNPRELNLWPLRTANGDVFQPKLHIAASSGETLLRLTKTGAGIACLSNFMTANDLQDGSLVQILKPHTLEKREAIHAVYYRNTQISPRISLFIDFLKERLKTTK